ncbi:hypothetical protein Dda_1744 [Drechslerella dactyloides]|uniref:Uncharacterized protein n=1 Tax=Drechslerella dactyloides TaxID=74499 RepID=A0AAD6NNB8_DREDA|nr:hypothetical protein Dda_1744 [Drechslerella dactyloides]
MALVAYSDSEPSDAEGDPPATAAPALKTKPKSKSSLASFLPPPAKKRKLVVDDDAGATGPSDGSANPSGPRKIKVDLPKISRDDEDPDALATSSSSRRGVGKAAGGSGLLSFLPAPKRTGAEAVKAAQEADKEEKKAEASAAAVTAGATPRTLGGGIKKVEYAGTGMDDDTPAPAPAPPPATVTPSAGPIQGRAIQPLFRKSTAKKQSKPAKPDSKDAKVSLFSLGSALAEKPLSAPPTGEYKPILIEDTAAPPVDDDEDTTPADPPADVEATYALPDDNAPAVGPQTFQSISEQVGMDEAEMRMFMGRRGRNAEIKLMDFNVDAEYEKNEAARAAGAAAPEKNVVRSIKPGKHQLTSLLNGITPLFLLHYIRTTMLTCEQLRKASVPRWRSRSPRAGATRRRQGPSTGGSLHALRRILTNQSYFDTSIHDLYSIKPMIKPHHLHRRYHNPHLLPNPDATRVASWMPLARVLRSRPSSSTSSPPIVQPAGVLTFSLIIAGCSPSITIPAVPRIVCAAIIWASTRGKPIITPPSAMASSTSAMKAGPLPHSAVEASMCFSGRKMARPICEKIQKTRSRSSCGMTAGSQVMTVMDSRMREAVLGITLIIRVDGSTCDASWERVTPAQMEMRSLPFSAARVVSTERISETICGLQPRMTMSESCTPRALSPEMTVTGGEDGDGEDGEGTARDW